ncbi:MAG TPA: hypothetical protein VKW08_14290 [Xanthobacteraceae bacterium]|jgi:hypothetical protein|nr:hypothetical protein [Xanthobacteraceae bacterium]
MRSLMAASVLAALLAPAAAAEPAPTDKYPDLKGQWNRFVVKGVRGQPSYDQTKSWGPEQDPPLTPEYQKVFQASLDDLAHGGVGNNIDRVRCGPAGMPLNMVGFRPLEFVVTPERTYVLVGDQDQPRRIFTDGRDWPAEITPTYSGYSIGRWIDTRGDGRFDLLEVETRGFKGPRVFDSSGLPMAYDNQSIFKERIYLDKANANILHDEITTIDHALTHPWSVDKRYVRDADPLAEWFESVCTEYNAQVFIGKQNYFLSADGYLMPAHKDQPPPDLRYFKKATK